MPALPKFDDTGRFKWTVEVFGQGDLEEARHPDGHVAVTAKVEIELQRKRQVVTHASSPENLRPWEAGIGPKGKVVR